MEQNNQQQAPQNINFDGDDYNVQDLTPRVANEFNTLFRIQNELNDLSYQIKKCQAAQTIITEALKEAIKEDKVKIVTLNKLYKKAHTVYLVRAFFIFNINFVLNQYESIFYYCLI